MFAYKEENEGESKYIHHKEDMKGSRVWMEIKNNEGYLRELYERKRRRVLNVLYKSVVLLVWEVGELIFD